jgi:hypothetical protein
MARKPKNKSITKAQRMQSNKAAAHVLSSFETPKLSNEELDSLKKAIYVNSLQRAYISNPFRRQSAIKSAAVLGMGAGVDRFQKKYGTGLKGDIENIAGDIQRVGRRINLVSRQERYKEVG